MSQTSIHEDDRPRIEVYNCAYEAIKTGKSVGLSKGEVASLTEDNIREVNSIDTATRIELMQALNIAAQELNYELNKMG